MSESNPLKAMIGRIDLLDRRVESLEVEEHAVSTARTTTTGGGTYVIEVLDFAINNVLLLKDGEPYPGVYPPTDAGLAAANAAATADDVVLVPVATFTGDYTVGTSVEWRGRGVGFSVLTGEITLSDGSLMDGLGIVRTADQAGDLVAIVPPASGMAYVEHCNIMAENANGAGYAAYGDCDHLTLRSCYVSAETAGVDAAPFAGETAEETVYFDASDAGPTDPDAQWTDDASAFDGVADSTHDAYNANQALYGSNTQYELSGTGTSAPSAGSGAIVNVQVRAHYATDTSASSYRRRFCAEVFSGAESLGTLGPVLSGGPFVWTSWATLSIPSGGWTWAKLAALEIRFWAGEPAKLPASGYVYVTRAETNVTYQASSVPVVHGCIIPNLDGREVAEPEYGDRSAWRTDWDAGAAHADDWEPGDSHHAEVTIGAGSDSALTIDGQELTLTLPESDLLTGGYLMAAFDEDNDNSLYILTSDDGITWSDLSKAPVYQEATIGLRDPSISYHGDQWWVAHTNTNAPYYQFRVLSSPNLTDWTLIHTLDAQTLGEASAALAWAPEWFVDDDGSVHLLVSVSDTDHLGMALYETHPTNAAYTAWSDLVEITGTGFPAALIDAFVVREGDTYYLWYKDEVTLHIEYATSSALTSGYVRQVDGDWAGFGSPREGMSLVRVDSDTWRIYYDHYVQNGVYYSESSDGFVSWSTPALISTPWTVSHPTVLCLRDLTAYKDVLQTTAWNADRLQGRDVASTAPSDGDALVWDAGDDQWEPADVLTPTEHTAIGDGAPHHAAVTLGAANDAALALDGQELTLTLSSVVSGELLMQDGVTNPPVPLETEDQDDWLYED